MELSELEKKIATVLFEEADGEDVIEIIEKTGYDDFLLHYLMMKFDMSIVLQELETKKQMEK